MGTVFSWPDICDHNVPEVSDFRIVLAQVREALRREPAIWSATAFGSVVRGDFNRRSDLDVAIIYDAEHPEQALALLERLAREAALKHVPLHFVPCSHRLASSTMHFFGPMFVDHLQRAADSGGHLTYTDGTNGQRSYVDNWFTPHPRDRIRHYGMDAREEIMGYLRHKLHKLVTGLAHYGALPEADQMRFLTKVLEAPMNTARKVLAFQGGLNGDDSKATVLCVYGKTAHSAHDKRLLKTAVALDGRYSDELERQLVHPNARKYQKRLQAILDIAPDVISFVKNNGLDL